MFINRIKFKLRSKRNKRMHRILKLELAHEIGCLWSLDWLVKQKPVSFKHTFENCYGCGSNFYDFQGWHKILCEDCYYKSQIPKDHSRRWHEEFKR